MNFDQSSFSNTPFLAVGLLVLLVVGLLLRFRDTDLLEDLRILRYTISVNLGILRSELTELSAIAQNASSTAAVEQARQLLSEAQAVLLCAETFSEMQSKRALGCLLTQVFDAMRHSTDARHLLGACKPHVFD